MALPQSLSRAWQRVGKVRQALSSDGCENYLPEGGRPKPRSHGTIIKSGPRPGKSRPPACPSHEFFARAGSDRPGSDEKNQGI